MKVINGKWSTNNFGDTIETTEQQQQFMDKLNRVKQFSNGRELTYRKVEVLFRILDTNETTDRALTRLLEMNTKEIKNLCLE
jgi:hypothetical protein